MAPFKSTLSRSASKLLGVFRETDLSLRGRVQSIRQTAFSASGGTEIVDGIYTYHVFTSPDTFETNATISVNYLVVGGGGGGAGGAGGFRNNTTTLTGSYAVEVGSGADFAGAGTDTAPGAYNGGDSSIAGVAVGTGGGAGGGAYPITTGPGQPGGSGGGGKGPEGTGGSSVASPDGVSPTAQGGAGGTGVAGPRVGGGGGAGGAGTNANPGPDPQASGDGGPGAPANWCPAPVLAPAIPAPVRSDWTTAVGPTGLFAGGGAGGTEGGTGGPGGGGSGLDPAVDFTGSGGGATGNGGDGIVVIRYQTQ